MRIWDIQPKNLCQLHLLGEHRELHAIWTILTQNKTGYARHPETLRWKNQLHALYNRHSLLVSEMKHRGYNHQSDLDKRLAVGSTKQTKFINSLEEQIEILKNKKCKCNI
ncbi:MAG: pyrimidine dimer DNA glycosylase [Thaumarchaeota archaeon]|nr:pyrimidine dimer DNA glycosylase [Nitrososphaerota archaeon]